MSRVGKQPVSLPSGVKAAISNGEITIEGPKGKLQYRFGRFVALKQEDDKLVVSPVQNHKQAQADYGTARSIVQNMVHGVSEGWKRALELNGVGFTAKLNGNTLTLATGYSHDVDIEIPKGVEAQVQRAKIELSSCDKQLLGELAAKIRRVCPPEPYLGKGVKYAEETVRRKAGKTGK